MKIQMTLVPGWRLKHYEIPFASIGKKTVKIKVTKGRVRLGHHVFDIQNGSWLEHPKGKPNFYILDEGQEYTLDFHLHHRHNRMDRLFLSNEQHFKSAEISIETMEKT